MNRQEIINQIKVKESFLCIGLDPDFEKMPHHLPKNADGVITFCKEIIDWTHSYCVAYKPNTAFFEVMGSEGLRALKEIEEYIPENIFKIADAKRGDIGNTSRMYARAFFESQNFDAITVAPYMGKDSVMPFLEFDNKWTIILGLTSNSGSQDFEFLETGSKPLYQTVLEKSSQWGTIENTMYVIGATQEENLKSIRKIIPNHFLLIPGLGAQGGSMEDVAKYLLNKDTYDILVSSSRGIIYASQEEDYAEKAAMKAQELTLKMKTYINT